MSKVQRALLATLVLFVVGDAFAKQPFEAIERKEIPVAPDIALSVELGDGTVHVYGSNENVIKLLAIKKAYSKERLDAIKVDVSVTAEAALVTTTFPPKPNGLSLADKSGTVDYVLIVPQTCTLKNITVENGEIEIDGLRGGGVDVRLTNGRIVVMNCFAPTNLSLGRGGMDIVYFWWENTAAFPVNATATAGDISVALPPNGVASFDAATQSGWIRNQFLPNEQNDSGQSLRFASGENPGTEIKLRASSGNIRIARTY